MPRLNYANTKIEVRVSPFVVGETKVNQLAWNESLTITQTSEGLMLVEMRVWLIPHAAVDAARDNGWGEEITDGPFTRRPFTLVANNDTLVEVTDDPLDPNFGRFLAIRYRSIQGQGQTPEQEWDGIVNSFPGNYLGQGDFMCYVRDNVPQKLGDVQRHHIHMADLGGMFSR